MGLIGYVFGYPDHFLMNKKEEKRLNLSFYAHMGWFPLLLDFTKKTY